MCLSVNQHLTSGASVRPESDTMYSADNEGENICSVLPETAPLQRSSTFYIGIYRAVRHFLLRGRRACALDFLPRGDHSGHFSLRCPTVEGRLCS